MKTNIPIKLLLSVISLYVMVTANSCNNEEILPPQNPVMVKLTLDDVGVTETWIKVSSGDANGTFALKRDSVTIASNLHAPLDTLIHDEGLLPNHTYQYLASTETPLNVTTMDTTSHNFTWKFETLGDGNASSLNDVAILNNTLVYAVGEINKRDSTGQFNTAPFGLAIWNGLNWKMQKLQSSFGPNGYRSDLAPKGIIVFSTKDIWFADGGVHHYNGENIDKSFWINNFPGNPSPIWGAGQFARKLWGTSSTNLYVVGTQGAIAYYNGTSWRKIHSGTTLDIQDIWGSYNKHTKEYEIFCVASSDDPNSGKKLLKISSNNIVSEVNSEGLSWSLSSLWFAPGKKYCIAGDGFYSQQSITPQWERNETLPPYYKIAVRGQNINDITVVCSYGVVLHYNGVNWKSYQEQTYLSSGVYGKVGIKNNLIIAVGYNGNKAAVAIGKR